MDSLLQINVTGEVELQHVFDKLTHALDVQEILDEGSAILLDHIRYRFLQCIDPNGDPWPVSKAAKKRASSGRGGGTLYDTGRLFHSIQLHQAGENGRAISTDVPYGKFHMTGTLHLPQRVFLGFNQGDADLMGSFVVKRISDALKE